MPGTINVFNMASSLDISPSFSPFTGVRLWYSDETYYFAGDETGRVLEADTPWATQEMADSILAEIAGYEYQPFTARTAIIDPAAELGDGVSVGGVYGPLAVINADFSAMFSAEIGAPQDEEMDHEFPYLSSHERKYNRQIAQTRSMISKTADEIRLEVTTLRTDTDGALDSLRTELGDDIADLDSDITERLVAYSTITMTDKSIASAVKESREYTDTKTGEIVLSLDNYSTIEQTAKSIELAVSGMIDEEYANSLITQAMDSIELSVSSSKGSTTLTLTGGGVELSSDTVELSVNAVNINGKINAENLNLTGAITFGDLDEDVQDSINDRGISAARARTIINDTLVSSPNIMGANYWSSDENTWMNLLDASETTVGIGGGIEVAANGITLFSVIRDAILSATLTAYNEPFLQVTSTGTIHPLGTWDFQFADVTHLEGVGGGDVTVTPVWG